MRTFIKKYLPTTVEDLNLDPDEFKDDTIWEKIIDYSNKEWKKEFNEQYIMHLITNFDSDRLIFNNKIFDTVDRDSH